MITTTKTRLFLLARLSSEEKWRWIFYYPQPNLTFPLLMSKTPKLLKTGV